MKEKRKSPRKKITATVNVGYFIDKTAMEEMVKVYKEHIADELNFGDGKNRQMRIAVPFWAVEGVAKGVAK